MDDLFEKIDIPFDINLLKLSYENSIVGLPPVMLNPFFGGWSITSSTGDYKDGWNTENPTIDATQENETEHLNYLNKIKFKGAQSYRIKTELCINEVNRIIDYLDRNNFFPCRARYMLLKPGGATGLHQDYPSWLYGVRLHIPIYTNTDCYFEYEKHKMNFLADGSAYLVKVNRKHRVYNYGNTNRIHFICDFFDLEQVTNYNKFTEENLKAIKSFRKNT